MLLGLGSLALGLTACSTPRQSDVGTQIGQSALSFRIARLDGGSDEIGAHHGQIVIVNLWASWCPACREELPTLERIAQREKGHVLVLGIDQGDDRKIVHQIITHLKLSYPMLLDHDQHYGANYATVGLPTSLLLDREGHIRLLINGAAEERYFERGIAALER